MKYMGSKGKVAKHILPFILKGRKPEQWYVEPFCGGCNLIDKVEGNRIANDINPYLIAFWDQLLNKDWLPERMSKDQYLEIKYYKDILFEPYVVGWAGFNLSYSGKFFGGFAGVTKTKIGTIRDYQKEAIANIEKQKSNLKGIVLNNSQYYDIAIPEKSIIYCDPPYEGTTGYKYTFDHNKFWQWCREREQRKDILFLLASIKPLKILLKFGANILAAAFLQTVRVEVIK